MTGPLVPEALVVQNVGCGTRVHQRGTRCFSAEGSGCPLVTLGPRLRMVQPCRMVGRQRYLQLVCIVCLRPCSAIAQSLHLKYQTLADMSFSFCLRAGTANVFRWGSA